MSVFLAVDENGVKLATKAKFWRAATEIMWKTPWDDIREAMTAAGWKREEKGWAKSIRTFVKESIDKRKEKEKKHQQAIAGIDMSVFLAVDANGEKLAMKTSFWKDTTQAIWDVPWEDIRNAMTAAGWTKREKTVAQLTRNALTPEVKSKRKAKRQTPEAKAKQKAYQQKPERKAKRKVKRLARHRERMTTDPEYAILYNSRIAFRDIYRSALKSGLYTPEQLAALDKRTDELVGCSSKELMEHLEKQFIPGMTHFNRGLYNPNDHMTNPKWQDDHSFPVKIMFKNKNILGLEEFVIGYKNHTPRDARFNQLKKDYIILECISPECPGYPFVDGLVGVERIFKTIDEFLESLPQKYNRSDFPLL